MPCSVGAGKGEELYSPGFRSPDSKGNGSQCLGWGGGTSPLYSGPASSLSHLNVQNQTVGKQSGILNSIYRSLEAFMWS